jgi:hypothetical protein
MAANGHAEPNRLALAAGFGVGVLWVLMGLWCLYNGIKGYSNDRTDYGLIWTVVGVLLFGCGSAALFGTWWHQFPLKRRAHHH